MGVRRRGEEECEERQTYKQHRQNHEEKKGLFLIHLLSYLKQDKPKNI